MLTGKWNITRRINGGAPLAGRADVSTLGRRQWLWDETLRTPLADGRIMEGVQSYEIRAEEGRIRIYFASGQSKGALFHDISLTRTPPPSLHLCGDDRYESRFEILGKHHLRVTHSVTGPRKDYVMVSDYERSGG